MALGCSTNSMLHLPAIANECGIDINLDMANEISAKTPNLCHLAPAGHAYMEDLNAAGGVYAVLNELTKKNLIHTDAMTVTGKTRGRKHRRAASTRIRTSSVRLTTRTARLAVLLSSRATLLPDRCVVKRSAVAAEMMQHRGPAKVFNSEEEAIAVITQRRYSERRCGCYPL